MTDPVANTAWTTPENWAWGEIVAGNVADFGAVGGALDPRSRKGWTEERSLSAAFLRAILFEKKWTDRIPVEGVRIVGACWREKLILSHARLSWPLCLERCRFERRVDLAGLRIDGRLSLARSVFRGSGSSRSLILDRCATGPADLSGADFSKDLAGASATIDGLLDMTGARLSGALWLKRAKLGCLFMRNGFAGEVTLTKCEIGQDVDFSGATLKGSANLDSISVGQSLLLGGSETKASSYEKDIVLQSGCVGGQVNLCGIEVDGALKMNDLEVKKHLFMRIPLGEERKEQKGEALFRGDIDLSFAVIRGHVELTGSKFEAPVNLTSIQIGENLHVWGGTQFEGSFNLNSGRVKGNVEFTSARFRDEVFAVAFRVEGTLTLNGARFRKGLNLADARIGGHLFMNDDPKSRFSCKGELRLTTLNLGGHLELEGNVHGRMTAWGLQVGGNFKFRRRFRRSRPIRPIFRNAVDLRFGTIKGTVSLDDARFDGGLSMLGTRVDQDLGLRSEFRWSIPQPTKPDDDHDPDALKPAPVADLSAATIGGQLTLELPLPETATNGTVRLDLRDAKAGSLQVFDRETKAAGWLESWMLWIARMTRHREADPARWPEPGSVQLDGFRYDRLGGFGVERDDEMAGRTPEWLKRWLSLDDPYSPQPYEQLAAVLRQAGEVERANRILHNGRERARKSAWSWRQPLKTIWGFPRAVGLFLLKITIGYGIGLRFFYALIWVGLFTAIGWWMLGPDPVGTTAVKLTGSLEKGFYSFDQLLPIIELDKRFSDVNLPEPVATYFRVHRFFGFLLGAFITAGIAGLTQRSRS